MLTSITTAMEIRQQIIESELLNSGDDENDYSIHYAFADENDMNDALIDTYEEIFYGILCSGLTEKTRLSFTSSNSSFSECVRNHNLKLSYNKQIAECITTHKEHCVNTQQNPLKEGVSHCIISCTFNSISSPVPRGGVLYLHHTSQSSTTSLTVDRCIFDTCNTTATATEVYGGGAIYVDCGSFYLSSSIFIQCSSKSYGGAIDAYLHCERATFFYCTFLSCHAVYG